MDTSITYDGGSDESGFPPRPIASSRKKRILPGAAKRLDAVPSNARQSDRILAVRSVEQAGRRVDLRRPPGDCRTFGRRCLDGFTDNEFAIDVDVSDLLHARGRCLEHDQRRGDLRSPRRRDLARQSHEDAVVLSRFESR